eukprot:2888343-Ditylum_brightwellii.AAC.1
MLRERQVAPILTLPIKGDNNTMADFATSSSHLGQEDLYVAAFSALFPLHVGSWTSVPLPAELL